MTFHSMYLKVTPSKGDSARATHSYLLRCTGETDATVYSWLTAQQADLSLIPIERPDGTLATGLGTPLLLSYSNLGLKNTDYKLLYDGTATGEPEIYEITATYQNDSPSGGARRPDAPEPSATPVITLGFDYSPDVNLILASLETVATFPGEGEGFAPAMNRAINVQPDGSVQGTQIPDPGQILTLSVVGYPLFFTTQRIEDICYARGKVNSALFTIGGTSYDPGEVRLLSATGQIDTDPDTQSSVDIRLGIINNVKNLSFPGIDISQGYDENNPLDPTDQIKVDGWDYYWVAYGEATDGNGMPQKKPRGLYVERLFERIDLNALFQ